MGEQLYGAEHVRRYLETDGEVGYRWRNGAPILILTTRGRKSGEERLRPLIFGEENGRYVVVASQGGAPSHPDWYLNLSADPNVHVQVKGDRFAARARTAEVDLTAGAERITLEVHDDGIGLGPTRRRSGLANLRRRAERHGGRLMLAPRRPTGTCLSWTIPNS